MLHLYINLVKDVINPSLISKSLDINYLFFLVRDYYPNSIFLDIIVSKLLFFQNPSVGHSFFFQVQCTTTKLDTVQREFVTLMMLLAALKSHLFRLFFCKFTRYLTMARTGERRRWLLYFFTAHSRTGPTSPLR